MTKISEGPRECIVDVQGRLICFRSDHSEEKEMVHEFMNFLTRKVQWGVISTPETFTFMAKWALIALEKGVYEDEKLYGLRPEFYRYLNAKISVIRDYCFFQWDNNLKQRIN